MEQEEDLIIIEYEMVEQALKDSTGVADTDRSASLNGLVLNNYDLL